MDVPEKYRIALASLEKTASECVDDFASTISCKATPERIYHYTDDLGFRGILESKILWVTDIFDLNDPSELRHGLTNSSNILSKLASKLSPECRLLASIFEEFARTGVADTGYYYCCSFSTDGDELGQWRAYAENGCGFALGFDAKLLEADFGKSSNNPSTFPVIYDDEELSTIQQELCLSALKAIQLPGSGYLKDDWSKEYSVLIGTILSSNSIYASLFFKHHAYRNESEYRFIDVFGIHAPPENRKFRSRPYSLVDYLEFPWGKKSIASLREVIIGPAADKFKATKYVVDCLKAFGFATNKVEIIHSKIPYRSTTL